MPLDDTTKHYEQALAPQADPFTLPALIAWLRTKPRRATYSRGDADACLLGQYAKEHDGGLVRIIRGGGALTYPTEYQIGSRTILVVPGDLLSQVAYDVEPFTFGAALARAEALAKSEAGPAGAACGIKE